MKCHSSKFFIQFTKINTFIITSIRQLKINIDYILRPFSAIINQIPKSFVPNVYVKRLPYL